MVLLQLPHMNEFKVHYDEAEDILHLGREGQENEVVELSPGVNIELDDKGNLFLYERPRGLTVLFILFAAMIALALFQMVPLPESVLKLISPASLTTYATFGNAPAGAYHPISINPDATRRELFRVLAYAAIFFVIISHYRTKEQVHSLVKTILYMGCFLVLFALIQKMTWNGRIFWIYPVGEGVPVSLIWGPYINHNHLIKG